MKTEIINSEEITKEIALNELTNTNLSKDEVNEYLDIITAINDGLLVYNLLTNNGEYLLFIEGKAAKDTKEKKKKSN